MILRKYKNYKIWLGTRGYPCIWVDGKEIKLHVYIWEEKNGSKPKGYEINHIDKNKQNYNLDNLELLTISDHKRIHKNWVKENGVWTKKPCSICKKILPLSDFYKTKQFDNYCKDCRNKKSTLREEKPEVKEIRKKQKHEYYLLNKETINKRTKEYYKKHKNSDGNLSMAN